MRKMSLNTLPLPAAKRRDASLSLSKSPPKRTGRSVISFILILLMVITAIPVFPKSAEASLLQLEERPAHLHLRLSTKQLKDYPVKTFLKYVIDDETGERIDLEGKSAFWALDNQSSLEESIPDSYHRITDDETMNLITMAHAANGVDKTIEIIVGNGKQLDPNNIRYITKVQFRIQEPDSYTLNVYEDSLDPDTGEAVRTLLTELFDRWWQGSDPDITANEHKVLVRNRYIELSEAYHPNIRITLTNSNGNTRKPKVYRRDDYLEYGDAATELTDLIYTEDPWAVGNGYRDTGMGEDEGDFENYLSYQGVEYNIGSGAYHFAIVYENENGTKDEYYESVWFDLGSISRVKLNGWLPMGTDLLTCDEIMWFYGVRTEAFYSSRQVMEGSTYYIWNMPQDPKGHMYPLRATSYLSTGGTGTDEIEKTVIGTFTSLEDAFDAENITDQLFGKDGYASTYDEPVDFTVFFKNELYPGDNILHFTIAKLNYTDYVSIPISVSPVAGRVHPWFQAYAAYDFTQEKYLPGFPIENAFGFVLRRTNIRTQEI